MSEPTEPTPADIDPESWGELVCVRCDQEFMLREDEAGAECPHCGAPANLSRPREGPGDFATLTPRRRQKRSRRKRKIHSEEDLVWEGDEKAPEKEGEISETFIPVPDRPGESRLKRVRRKKLPTRWEKLTAKVGIWTKVLLVVGGAAVLYLVFQTLFVVTVDDTDKSEPSNPESGADATDTGEPSTIVTPEEKAACVAVANAFYAAGGVGEKMASVRQPERVEQLMQDWYQKHEDDAGQITEVVFGKKREVGGRQFITLAVEFEGGAQRIISFEQSGEDMSPLLDWEVSVGYQAMPLMEFQDSRPQQGVPFRVLAKLGEDYPAPFEDADAFQCVLLTYPGDKDFKLTGYIEREAEWAFELLGNLEFGASSVILSLKFPPDAVSDQHVEVVGLEHDSWFY